RSVREAPRSDEHLGCILRAQCHGQSDPAREGREAIGERTGLGSLPKSRTSTTGLPCAPQSCGRMEWKPRLFTAADVDMIVDKVGRPGFWNERCAAQLFKELTGAL